MRSFAVALAAAAFLAVPVAGAGQALVPRLAGAELVETLKRGGYVILMRHARTEHVARDPALFDLRDCSTQRGLSDAGREQARQIGHAYQKLGIPVGEVLSSPYCRCLETGSLAFGRVEESELLSVWDDLSVPEKSGLGGDVRQALAQEPAPGTNTVLITHTGTLLYSFGLDARPEGIAHVFERGPVGNAQYVGRLLPDELIALAGPAAATR